MLILPTDLKTMDGGQRRKIEAKGTPYWSSQKGRRNCTTFNEGPVENSRI